MNEATLFQAYSALRESPAAVERRLEHGRELDRLFASGRVDEAQALIELWSRENAQAQRAARDPR